MKNIHVLPTDKRSRLRLDDGELVLGNSKLCQNTLNYQYQNIYITNDEEIKEGDWFYDEDEDEILKAGKNVDLHLVNNLKPNFKKIILTTDQSLDGVQKIDDEFLEWFIKNPSCEMVELEATTFPNEEGIPHCYDGYKIIIPQEEPKQELERGITITHVSKQETLEEAAERLYPIVIKPILDVYDDGVSNQIGEEDINENNRESFIEGAKWQQERMYSEEEVIAIVEKSRETGLTAEFLLLTEQFKKK
jgi:hypothetical protein